MTSDDVIRRIDQLLDRHTEDEIANELNRQRLQSGSKLPFTMKRVVALRRTYKLRCRFDRLRARGLHTADEMADELGVCRQTIRIWHKHGLLKGYNYTCKGEKLYELPPQKLRPQKQQGLWGKLTKRAQCSPFTSHAANEVYLEA